MANNTNSKKGSFGTTMGVASVIAILVILVLIVFSALSITTAKADLGLSEKTASATSAYYKADGAAEEKFAEIAAAVKGGGNWQGILTEAGYVLTDEPAGTRVAYEIDVDGSKMLKVEILVSADGEISRELWQIVSTAEWNPEKELDLFQ